MIVVRAIVNGRTREKIKITAKKYQSDPEGAIRYAVLKRATFVRPKRLEWVVNPITGEIVMAVVEDDHELVIFEIA